MTRLEQKADTPLPATNGHPGNAIEKMAVLFTDIVGSSGYFKARGDVAGRKMLKEHQDLASPAVFEHGGVVVKMLGDSVMAYFLDPREALKSGMKIQQRFRDFNREKTSEDQIHIRLCIHYGDGIVEDGDIFGDVVNMAAKFLPVAQGDQILISREIYEQVQGLLPIRVEQVSFPEDAPIPDDMILYAVMWDEGMDLNPLSKILLYFRPLFQMGTPDFPGIWDRLLRMKNELRTNRIEKASVLQDKSLVLILNDPGSALTFCSEIRDFLNINLGRAGALFLPVQIVADLGVYLRAGALVLDNLHIPWDSLEPGRIHISPSAYNIIRSSGTLSLPSRPESDRTRPFFKISLDGQEKDDKALFLYQGVLSGGAEKPCFYCGDTRHPAMRCPSKRLTELTEGLNRLGYLTLEEINRAFFTFLSEGVLHLESDAEIGLNANRPAEWAFLSFYELKTVCQLRFFRTIWNAREENWNKIRERKDDRGNGGLVWIGQDCIRVSNLDQAESILKETLKKDPMDYKAYCGLGFLNVEKDEPGEAKHYFKKALEYVRTGPQKIFMLFLLARLYEIENDQLRAEDMVRKILQINPHCPEAVYKDILFQFRRGKEGAALQQLSDLIKKAREYYIVALIDPELAPFSEMIAAKLKSLLEEAQGEAQVVQTKAEQEMGKIQKWLDEEEDEVREARSLWNRIRELSGKEGYFAYLDIIHFGNSLINMARVNVEERRKRLTELLMEMRGRVERDLAFIRAFPYGFLIDRQRKELRRIQLRVEKNWTLEEPRAVKFKEAFALAEELLSDLKQIEMRLERLDVFRRILIFLTSFVRKSLIFQSANLLIAIIFFPIIAYYLNFLVPDFRITPDSIWAYQKYILTLGGLSGGLLAVITSTGGFSKR
ncbi:MAG: hypothetical protein JW821_10550 [Deltaproteobacteria bacterium]|nr:hypothetical protein [Deltaproteobacteria bacterium]